jgi:subfamily B ATP-binding cassette protein MsbA
MMHRRSGGRSNDDDLKKKIVLADVWRVLSLAIPFRGILICAAFFGLIGSAFQLALPVIAQRAVDRITHTAKVSDVDLYSAALVGFIILSSLSNYAQFILSARAGNDIVRQFRARLFSHIQRLPVAYFDKIRSGDLGSHLSNDVSQLQVTLATDVAGFAGSIFLLGGGLLMAIYLNWRLTVIMTVILVFVMAFFVVTGRRLRKMNRAALDALADAMGSMSEAIANIRLVKAFAREPYEDRRSSERLATLLTLSNRSSAVEGLMMTVGVAGSFLMIIGCLWFGGRGVLSGAFTSGDVAGFLMALIVILAPMANFAALFTRLQRTVGAAERLFAILDLPTEEPDPTGAIQFPDGPGSVEFRSVEFSYTADQPVLTGLNLALEPGKVTALVGPSGSGKTTLASLLYRFYEPQSGTIKVNGKEIAEIKRDSLRENIGIVPQEPILFNGTIMENIRYGRLDATDSEVRQAAQDANVEEFVSGFSSGYQTIVGERGITLSGGQRQRVAIARAVLKNPKLLILDEATSALDNRSEALVREALDRLMLNRTTLIIAHRLSTVRNADKIAVVSEGKIVESGTHTQLLEHGGKYAELYELV